MVKQNSKKTPPKGTVRFSLSLSEEQKSAIKYIISQNQVYYLHFVLLIIELFVLLFLMKSFVRNKQIS